MSDFVGIWLVIALIACLTGIESKIKDNAKAIREQTKVLKIKASCEGDNR